MVFVFLIKSQNQYMKLRGNTSAHGLTSVFASSLQIKCFFSVIAE